MIVKRWGVPSRETFSRKWGGDESKPNNAHMGTISRWRLQVYRRFRDLQSKKTGEKGWGHGVQRGKMMPRGGVNTQCKFTEKNRHLEANWSSF